MKKIISLIVFMNLTNLCAKEIDLDMSMGVDIGCNISCSDFNFGTLRITGTQGSWMVYPDATIYYYEVDSEELISGGIGSGGGLFGAVPTVCNVVCPSDIESVYLEFDFDGDSMIFAGEDGGIRIGMGFPSEKEGVDWESEQSRMLSDGQDSFALVGRIDYRGYVPKGNYSTTFHVTISY